MIAQQGPVAGEQAVPPDGLADMITHLAISPDGRFVVIGRESGRLTRYEGGRVGESDVPAKARRAPRGH